MLLFCVLCTSESYICLHACRVNISSMTNGHLHCPVEGPYSDVGALPYLYPLSCSPVPHPGVEVHLPIWGESESHEVGFERALPPISPGTPWCVTL